MRGAGARGVTLLEMLIALTVLTLALLAMAGLFPTAYTNVARGGEQTAATALARQMIEMIRGEASFDAIVRYAALDTTTAGTGDWLALNGPEHSGAGAPGRLDRWRARVLALPTGRGRVAVIVLGGGVGPNGTPYARMASVTVTVEYREGAAAGQDAVLSTYVTE